MSKRAPTLAPGAFAFHGSAVKTAQITRSGKTSRWHNGLIALAFDPVGRSDCTFMYRVGGQCHLSIAFVMYNGVGFISSSGVECMGRGNVIEPSVAEVFITAELQKRAPKKTDYLQEKLALQDLAGQMADHPEDVLPRFVDLAMSATNGVAGGLSLYEEQPSPGVFRWRYLRGILAAFEGATTPRDFSPCGVTLDHNGPVLSLHPERVYSWISDANIIVPELLLVPLYLGSKEPLGTLWIVSDTDGHFDSGHARVLTELASFVGIALRMAQTQQRLQKALEEQETLTTEMSHRAKNLFAMTDGMVRVSAKGASTKDEMARLLSGRLHALSSADALVRSSSRQDHINARGSDLSTLIQMIMRPHESGDGAVPRFSFDGPMITCRDSSMSGFALVFHELATNATKYGALRADEGRVSITWQRAADKLDLRWIERGGPPILGVPAAKGFGSKLVQTTIVGQLGGTVDYEWHPEGLTVKISLPPASLAN